MGDRSCACGGKGYGRFQVDLTYRGNDPISHLTATDFFESRGPRHKITVDMMSGRVRWVHTAHNRHNGHHDIERRLAEFLTRRGIDPSRVEVKITSTGTWTPLPCPKVESYA